MFLYNGVSIQDTRFDVNKDIYYNRLFDEDGIKASNTAKDSKATIVDPLIGNEGAGNEEEEVVNVESLSVVLMYYSWPMISFCLI